MLIRYKLNEHGKRVAVAKIYTAAEHRIDSLGVDPDARSIIDRLKKNGYEAYIVGGAVRDLLLGKSPKDFDIATSASPKQIRKIFWNSRVIGRRFKLVHIYFQEKIFEVSTFRSSQNDTDSGNNIYGTLEEDAKRRDFSLNGMYFDPIDDQVLDFNDSMKDMKAKRMRSIIPLNKTFVEDPVRMVRCIKYAAIHDFSIGFLLDRAIKRYSRELARCSSSRMTEEVFKILQCGHSAKILSLLLHYRLLEHMLPTISGYIGHGKNRIETQRLEESLIELDRVVKADAGVNRSRMLAGLVDPFLSFPDEYENSLSLFRSVFKQIKQIISPITPPNYEVERAVEYFFKQQGVKVPKNAVRKPPTSPTVRQNDRNHPRKASTKQGSSSRRNRRRRPRSKGSEGNNGEQPDKKG